MKFSTAIMKSKKNLENGKDLPCLVCEEHRDRVRGGYKEENEHRSRLRRLIDALNIAIGLAQEDSDDQVIEDNYRALARLKVKIWGEDRKWVEDELDRLGEVKSNARLW